MYRAWGLNNGPRSRARVSIRAIYRAKFFIDDNKLRAQFWRIVERFIRRANNSIR